MSKPVERAVEHGADRFLHIDSEERADLRDWYDTSGTWISRMTSLYALVKRLGHRRARLGWEQGWVARGNGWDVTDNPYGTESYVKEKP